MMSGGSWGGGGIIYGVKSVQNDFEIFLQVQMKSTIDVIDRCDRSM